MDAQPGWEIFEGRSPRGKRGGSFASIKPKGQIALSKAAFAIPDPPVVLLAFNDRRSTIGIRPTTEDDSRAYRVARFKNAGGLITCREFFRHHNLVPDEPRRYPVTQEGEWTIIHLTNVDAEVQEGGS